MCKKIQPKLQQTNRLWQNTKFHPNQLQNFRELGHQNFRFLIKLWLWMKVKQSIYHHTKFQANRFINVWMHASVSFHYAVSRRTVISLVSLYPISFKSSIKMFNLNCFNTISNSIPISWIVCKKMKPTTFALHWPCEPQAGTRSVKAV